jgi:hypothetical protein
MKKLLRWVLVPLAGFAVWYLTFQIGFVGLALLDRLCPPEFLISGACTATWHRQAVDLLTLLCTAIVTAGLVLVPAFVAPTHRFQVALQFFLFGGAFAIYAALSGSLWGPFLVSSATGLASLWWARSRWGLGASAA